MKQKILVIVGATASGKTALAIALAKKFGGEIISADSRQVCRGMDIGTAKAPISHEPYSGESAKSSAPPKGGVQITSPHPSLNKEGKHPAICEGVPHWLVNIKNPDEEYNLADFKKDALSAIEDITSRGKLPIIVGGTGLYVSALVDGWDPPAVKPDPALRKKLEGKIKKDGLKKLFDELVALDPEAAYIVDPKNPRRVVRALEIALTTGKPFSSQRRKVKPPYNAMKLGITKPREMLCYSTARRVDEMVKNGLVEEVRGLIKKYGAKPVAFDAIGYREIIAYLENTIPLDEAVALIKKNTIAYAKRQVTWFKKDKEIIWIENAREAERLVREFL